jgi:hypothetical protein
MANYRLRSPEPVCAPIEVSGINKNAAYELYSIDGKENTTRPLGECPGRIYNLPSGTYFAKLSEAETSRTRQTDQTVNEKGGQ